MRKLSILALGIVFVVASCQKSSVIPPSNSSSASTINNLSTAKKSNLFYLTAHTWKYNKYYTGYVDSTNEGTLVYKRGSSHNTMTLDKTRVTYYSNGTAIQLDENGAIIPCTWHFTNANQTEMVTSNYTGDYYATI